MDGSGGQLRAHTDIVTVCRHCADHVSWIDIFEGYFQAFCFAVFYDLVAQEGSDILSYGRYVLTS